MTPTQQVVLIIGVFLVVLFTIGGLWWWALAGMTPEQGAATLGTVLVVACLTVGLIQFAEEEQRR